MQGHGGGDGGVWLAGLVHAPPALASPGSSCSRTEGWVLAGRLPREGGLLPPSSPLYSPTSLRQGALTRCPSTRLFLEARATRSASNRAQPYLIRLLRLMRPSWLSSLWQVRMTESER